MTEKKQLIIFLAGGLGNQLFQLYAAKALAEDREIVGEIGFSGSRNLDSSHPNIADLVISQNIELIRSYKLRLVTQKIFDMLISVSTKIYCLKRLKYLRITAEIFGTVYFSFYYRKILYVSISKGVGFHEIPRRTGHQILIGYFQSYKYSSEVFASDEFFEIAPVIPGSDFQYMRSRAMREKPIMVHIRLGDYLLEPKFGIPSAKYYKKAIEQLKSFLRFSPIWVFTDDIEECKKMFANYLPENVNWIGNIDNSVGSTLALFRYGAGYVIANSSFSWWSAWSRHDRSAKVIYPEPWFIGLETPQELIPPGWESLNGHAEEEK
jgi:hypothetical protein